MRMNEAGQVAGVAARYAGGGGQSAWLYSDGATKEIGLTGPGHDDSTYGTRQNEVLLLNGSGQVAGRAKRLINGYGDNGYSTWLYNGSTTQQVGLTGAAYTNSSTGYQLNEVAFLNESGYVAGRASRFDGSQSKGTSTWIYNGVTTVEIGLTDAAHTGNGYSSGYQYNRITHLNARGQAAGNAQRFTDGGGQSAWFYDPLSDVTYNMNEHLTGGVSYIDVLRDDGLALGSYYGSATGSGAFAFSVEDGWHELGSLVEGGLSEEGWSYLAEAYGAGADDILGYGKIGSAQALYLLTPVPEADTWALLIAGLTLVGAAARRRKNSGFN